jgi:hypothetical protein
MKRITLEEANKYIPLDDDHTIQDLKKAKYFTLIPHPDPQKFSLGWEEVKYFTSKRKNIYTDRGEGNQWVYILSNPSIPNLLKIGYTNLTPELRAKQISSSTGVVIPFKIEWTLKCFDGLLFENEIHKALKDYRVNNQREFFQIDLEEAKKIIILIGEKYT